MSAQKSNGPIIDPALCRCCRAIKKCRVLTAEYNWMGKKEVYADMVMDCYGILLSHVDDNEKDSGVCATCVVRLREAIAFRHQVLQCEELFLQAKLAPPEEETNINYESKLKKLELETIELKTEPKDYNSDHNSIGDDRDDALPTYSDDEDNKPLKPESKPSEPLPLLKDEELKSEDSEDFNGSSSDSDEPIKKKTKRKKKANGKDKEGKKKAKKQKADTDQPEDAHTENETAEEHTLTEEIHIKEEIHIEYTDSESEEYPEVPVEYSAIPETRKRKRWVRDRGAGVSEYEQLNEDNDEIYFEHMNMSKSSFEELHGMVEVLIEKTETNFRNCISTRERLAICLRVLRSGYSFKEISEKYRVGRTTVSNIVKDVSRALWSTLQPTYMPAPKETTWRQAEAAYKDISKFPNCVGSIGGRHIVAKQIKKDSEFPKVSDKACHKRFVSIALIAVTDPFNRILALDIGNYAKVNSNILESSKFFSKYMEKKDFLPWTPLPGDGEASPYVVLSSTFTTRHNLLRVFPRVPGYTPDRKIFNQYLLQAITVEKTFDMLMNSWTILLSPMESHIDTAVAMVKAICCLHNYVLAKHGTTLPVETKKRAKKRVKGGKKLKGLKPLRPTNHRASNVAVIVRDRFVEYFNRLGPLELDPNENDESLDPSDTEATGTQEQNEADITMGHFLGQMQNETNPDSTLESLQISNVSIKVKIEPESEPHDFVHKMVESSNEPNDSSGKMVELSNEPNDSSRKMVTSSNEPNDASHKMVESSNEPNDASHKMVESSNEPNDSRDEIIELSNKQTDSADIKMELSNEPTDSASKSESQKQSQSVPVGSDDFDSINVAIHSVGSSKSFDDQL